MEQDRKIHSFAHQPVGVANCRLAIVAVVHHYQFQLRFFGGAHQAGLDILWEGGFHTEPGGLRGVLLLRAQQKPGPILVSCHLLQEAALMA